MDIYQKNGFKNRKDYLIWLSKDYNIDIKIVLTLATVLGPDEDFDGLLVELDGVICNRW